MALPQAKISRPVLRKALKTRTTVDLAEYLGISRMTLHRLLNEPDYQPRALLSNYINAKLARLQ
jgi:DNA-binding XRE family transcriptional regulator